MIIQEEIVMLVNSKKSKELVSVLKQQGDLKMPNSICVFQVKKNILGMKFFRYPPLVSELLETAGQYSEILIRNSFKIKKDYLLLASVSNVEIRVPPSDDLFFSFQCSLCEYAMGFYRTTFVAERLISDSQSEKYINGEIVHKLL